MTTIWFSVLDSEGKESVETPFISTKVIRPLFGKPKEIGYFSIDRRRNIIFDRRQMKYLSFPFMSCDINMDLKVNSNMDTRHNYVTIEKMYQILMWLLHNKERCGSILGNLSKKPDFITVRGTLALVLCTPDLKGYYRDQWEICASKFDGIIYFSAIDTDEDIKANENITPRMAALQSWGYKFEQYMTSDTVDGKCNMESNTFQMEEFCILLENKLGNYSLLYKAEIDAVIPSRSPGPGSGDTACYTELKTHKIITGSAMSYLFHKHKMKYWWAQSYLAGIPEIICGLRDDNGIVKEVEVFRVSDLPKKAFGLWSADVCLSFCEKFLDVLQQTVIEDNAREILDQEQILHPCQYYSSNTIKRDIYNSKLKKDNTYNT